MQGEGCGSVTQVNTLINRVSSKINLRNTLNGIPEFVVRVRDQRIEGIAEPALTDKFQSQSSHPVQNIDVSCSVLQLLQECGLQLWMIVNIDMLATRWRAWNLLCAL